MRSIGGVRREEEMDVALCRVEGGGGADVGFGICRWFLDL